MTLRRALVVVAFVVPVLVMGASPARAADALLTATLTGAAAIPPGDPDGSGFAWVAVDDDTNQVCVFLSVRNIEPATAAHIHIGVAGENGGHAVTLNPPTTGWSFTCRMASEAVVTGLTTDPSGYYVQVHNQPYRSGALRGQLTAA